MDLFDFFEKNRQPGIVYQRYELFNNLILTINKELAWVGWDFGPALYPET